MCVLEQKGKTCITGLQLSYVDPSGHTETLGHVDLHDSGVWKEHRLAPGDKIIGIHGLMNNVIRGLGFIIMNEAEEKCTAKASNGSILCCG